MNGANSAGYLAWSKGAPGAGAAEASVAASVRGGAAVVEASDERGAAVVEASTEARGEAPTPTPTPTPESPADQVKASLRSMGFEDEALLSAVLSKHGPSLEDCARGLANATEWLPLLADLEEMGFANTELNKQLMLMHNGSVKRTVKALIEDERA